MFELLIEILHLPVADEHEESVPEERRFRGVSLLAPVQSARFLEAVAVKRYLCPHRLHERPELMAWRAVVLGDLLSDSRPDEIPQRDAAGDVFERHRAGRLARRALVSDGEGN